MVSSLFLGKDPNRNLWSEHDRNEMKNIRCVTHVILGIYPCSNVCLSRLGNSGGQFSIDLLSGLITRGQRALDRETSSSHLLEVEAYNSDQGSMRSSVRVCVCVCLFKVFFSFFYHARVFQHSQLWNFIKENALLYTIYSFALYFYLSLNVQSFPQHRPFCALAISG